MADLTREQIEAWLSGAPMTTGQRDDVLRLALRALDQERDARPEITAENCAHTAESWNAKHPVGTRVRFWPIYPPIDGVPPVDTETRSEAWAIGDGSVLVSIVGKNGGVCLTHVEVLP